MMTREAAAAARAAGMRAVMDRPQERRAGEHADARGVVPTGRLTVRESDDGEGSPHVVGMACVTERGYEMWDAFGPYTEVVALDAFVKTLAADPRVEYVLNHGRNGGAPMATTRNGTVTLGIVKDGEETGLSFDAEVDPSRTDVADMLKAMRRGDLEDASFKFRIVLGQWSPDYTEYRIEEVDMNDGDVSSVNVGASPHAHSALRSATAPAPKSGREYVSIADLTGRGRY